MYLQVLVSSPVSNLQYSEEVESVEEGSVLDLEDWKIQTRR